MSSCNYSVEQSVALFKLVSVEYVNVRVPSEFIRFSLSIYPDRRNLTEALTPRLYTRTEFYEVTRAPAKIDFHSATPVSSASFNIFFSWAKYP